MDEAQRTPSAMVANSHRSLDPEMLARQLVVQLVPLLAFDRSLEADTHGYGTAVNRYANVRNTERMLRQINATHESLRDLDFAIRDLHGRVQSNLLKVLRHGLTQPFTIPDPGPYGVTSRPLGYQTFQDGLTPDLADVGVTIYQNHIPKMPQPRLLPQRQYTHPHGQGGLLSKWSADELPEDVPRGPAAWGAIGQPPKRNQKPVTTAPTFSGSPAQFNKQGLRPSAPAFSSSSWDNAGATFNPYASEPGKVLGEPNRASHNPPQKSQGSRGLIKTMRYNPIYAGQGMYSSEAKLPDIDQGLMLPSPIKNPYDPNPFGAIAQPTFKSMARRPFGLEHANLLNGGEQTHVSPSPNNEGGGIAFKPDQTHSQMSNIWATSPAEDAARKRLLYSEVAGFARVPETPKAKPKATSKELKGQAPAAEDTAGFKTSRKANTPPNDMLQALKRFCAEGGLNPLMAQKMLEAFSEASGSSPESVEKRETDEDDSFELKQLTADSDALCI